jgi:actin-related protein
MERLWAKVLAGLNVKRSKNHSPVLLTIPSKWTRQDRERIVKIFFEKFNVPGLYIAEKPLATLYGYGQFLDGVVIDFGADEVSVYPVVEAQVLYPYIASVKIGTLRLKEYLKSLLLADPVFVQEFGSSDIPSDLLDHLFQHVVEVSIPGNDPVGVPKVKTRATVEYQGKKVISR